MLTIICGENTVGSRNYISELKKQYKKNNYVVRELPINEINSLFNNEENQSLFGQQKMYFTQNLSSLFSKKRETSLEQLKELAANKNISLIDWEEHKSARDLTTYKSFAQVKEFKPEQSIFQLLDACYPSNLHQFCFLLENVAKTQDEVFIFIMLARHLRTLIQVSSGSPPSTLAPWQLGKLSSTSRKWDEEKLVNFYVGLSRIDQSLKTSSNVYGLKASLEILACYYL